MNRERLQHLITVLKRVPARKFDISLWFHEGMLGQRHACGTVACALGHACIDRTFKAQGLGLNDLGGPCYRTKAGIDRSGFEAGAAFFNIGGIAALYLFDGGTYDVGFGFNDEVRPKHVIERIELLLAAGVSTFNEMMRSIDESSWPPGCQPSTR